MFFDYFNWFWCFHVNFFRNENIPRQRSYSVDDLKPTEPIPIDNIPSDNHISPIIESIEQLDSLNQKRLRAFSDLSKLNDINLSTEPVNMSSKPMNEVPERMNLASSWTWSWGDLPVKSKAHSMIDLS